MKKLIFPIVCCFISVTVSAQLIKPKAETQKKQSELDWFNCSFDQDSVYGAEVNKAYDYLKANKKKAKKRPVVALIGTEMEVTLIEDVSPIAHNGCRPPKKRRV